jgi:hypothetical protein
LGAGVIIRKWCCLSKRGGWIWLGPYGIYWSFTNPRFDGERFMTPDLKIGKLKIHFMQEVRL